MKSANLLLLSFRIIALTVTTSTGFAQQQVGINTPNPQAPLHITGDGEIVRLQGSSPYISFFNTATYNGYLWAPGFRMDLGSASGSTLPVTITAGSSLPTYFLPNGNVGIGGVNNPLEIVDVAGNIKFSGALKPGGLPGTPGQVLVSNGGGSYPLWVTIPNMYNNIYHVASSSAFVVVNSGLPDADFPGLNQNIVLSGNAKVMISYSVRAISSSCFACAPTYYEYFINVDGTNLCRNFQNCDNANSNTSSQTFTKQLGAGSHTIVIKCHYYSGPDLRLYGGSDLESSMDIVVRPQ
ncbi:MAG: hypothetical protein ABIX01_22805 [Chitinophagaceae bacterium]